MEKTSVRTAIGVGGWEHEVLDSCFYPSPSLDALEKLSCYSRSFDFVEVRPTFWDNALTTREASEWVAAVRPNRRFQFGVKLHRSFTHKKELTPKGTRVMRGLLHELARNGRLGALVGQFPYSFTNTSANRFYLVKLGEVFSGFPFFVELRHSSWDFDGLSEFLHEQVLQIVNADLPRLKQYPSFRSEVIGDTAYLRLHGRNEKGWLVNAVDSRYDYLYNGRELQELKRRVDRIAEKGKGVIVVFNNTTGGKAVANAFQLQGMMDSEKQLHVSSQTLRSFPFLSPLVPKETGQTEIPGKDLYREAM
jgi:uncharacterized protein YecE (DUF72 family)